MTDTMFDDFERTDLATSSRSESTYEYLNRTARPAFAVVRQLLDAWFRDYPDDGRDELLTRFRAPRVDTHSGAFFELYCHALLKKHGFSLVPHPSLDGQLTAPDFLVSQNGNRLFYFEATLAMPTTAAQASASRDAGLEDAINKMHLRDFYIGKSVSDAGKSSPSWKGLREFITTSAAGLNPDDAAACKAARFRYRIDDWAIDIWFLPKKPEARSDSRGRALGMTSAPMQYSQPQEGIKSSLKKKASKYGDLDLPYVVAINCLHDFVDDQDIAAALFGDEEFLVSLDHGVTESRRRKNGFWWGPQGYKNGRVSGILFANQLVPWTVGGVNPELWCNPFAKRPFEDKWWKCAQYVPNDETRSLELRSGTAAPDFLGARHILRAIRDERGESD
jgi:hypothetical protein